MPNDSRGVELPPAAAPAQTQAEPPAEWKTEFQKVVSQRDMFKAQAAEHAAKVATYEAEIAAKEAEKAQRREQDEQRKLAEAGQYQEIIAKNEQKWKQELASKESAFSNALLPLYIKAAAADIPQLTPEAKADLPGLLREYIRTDAQGNAYVLENGQKKLADDGKPYDPTKFIAEFVQKRSYMMLDTMPKSHGAQQAGKGDQAVADLGQMMQAKDNDSMAKWQEKDPEGFRQALRAYTISLQGTARKLKR